MRAAALRVFITGASSGLGRALAFRYAHRGAAVGIAARRREPLEQLAKELGPSCDAYALDVRDPIALEHAATHFNSRRGCPQIVIANAGVSVGTSVDHAADLRALRDTVDINLFGLANTFSAFIAPMRAAGGGRLVGIASVAGYRGLPGAAAYSASKAAAIAYLESVRVELHGTGIAVSTICPGYIATPMTARNPYRMPFILSADAAAERIAIAIERGQSYAVVPWQMAIVARVLRVLPDPLYDSLFARAPRKPRGGQ